MCFVDFPIQEIITRDNVEIKVHPMLLYKIVDPVRAIYGKKEKILNRETETLKTEVTDLPQSVEKLVQTTLRSIIGDMGLDE